MLSLLKLSFSVLYQETTVLFPLRLALTTAAKILFVGLAYQGKDVVFRFSIVASGILTSR